MEKKIEYFESGKGFTASTWLKGTLYGFGIDYECTPDGAGHDTRAIVLNEKGEFKLLPLNCIRARRHVETP